MLCCRSCHLVGGGAGGERESEFDWGVSVVAINIANLTILKVGTGGEVQLYNSLGSVNLVIDVVGYFTS